MDRNKAGYLEGVISIVINTLLFVLKFWAGTVSGSLALIADAWHTLSDSISSVVVVIGVRLSKQSADKKHPFGHGRWEQISAMFIGFILAFIAYEIMRESVVQFRAQASAHFGTLAIVVTIVSILVKEALAQYAFFLGRKTGNSAIKADGWHHRSDALSSVIVLIGIFFQGKFWWVDSLLGFIISIMLFFAVYQIFREAVTQLLGEMPSESLIDEIKEIVSSNHHDNLIPHHFHIHNYVTHRELTFHIKMDSKLSIQQGHDIATKLEEDIREKLNMESTIHVEPIEKKC